MKIKQIWLFIISIFFFNGVFSQKKEIDLKQTNKTYRLRLGADITKITLTQFDSNYEGYELVGDLLISKKTSLAIEIGIEDNTEQSEQINFRTNGNYIKLGFDYNIYKNVGNLKNDIYIGLRYAFSNYSLTVNNYLPYSLEHYWEIPLTESEFATGSRENLNSSWLEFIFGIKVQLLKNLYFGASLRLGRVLNQDSPDNFENLRIPSFGKVTTNNSFGTNANYTITYAIPLQFKRTNKRIKK